MLTSILSGDELREVAGRASTIDERRAGLAIVEEPTDDDERERVLGLLSDWRQAAAAGDDKLFVKRLRRDGLDKQTALHLLGRARLPAELPLPRWALVFQHVITEKGDLSLLPPIKPLGRGDDTEPAPFQELLWPIVVAARRLLDERTGHVLLRLFAGSAIVALEHSLLLRLAILCGPGLFGDFSLFRHVTHYQRGRFSLPFSKPGSRVIYEAYLDAWRTGRCRDFFLAHPVAARLIGVTVSHWVEGTAELVERLARDLPAIGEMFSVGVRPGPVEAIETDLSDPHRGGRTVAILTFANDLKLVYKPKDLRIDAAWCGLVGWLDDRGAPVGVKPVRVLSLDGYGWAEFIRSDRNADEVGHEPDHVTFYRRAGGLLALLHMLRGTDFHHENVVSSDGFPVPVDLETLLHPDVMKPASVDPADDASESAMALLKASVLATLYLPTRVLGPGGRLNAIGGLDDPSENIGTVWRFRQINTDAMAAIGAPAFTDEPEPIFGNTTLVAAHFQGFMEGFNELYAFMSRHRAALLAPNGPLLPFRGLVVRVIVKATLAYGLVQRRARAYPNLFNGAAWSIHFELLASR